MRKTSDARCTRSPAITGAVFALATALAISGCATSGTSSLQATLSPSTPAIPGDPAGLIVLGHSALTGEGSAPSATDARANSWASGTNPAVQSIYMRMLATRPEMDGLVANKAVGGARAATLGDQAEDALDDVASPELAIIQTIDNDIRCDGTDEANASDLQASVLDALYTISERSPETKILLVSQVGRPLPHAQMRYEAGTSWQGGDDACDFFDSTGNVVPEKAEHLTRIIEGYEEAQLAACAQVSTCHSDEGHGSTFVEEWAFFEGGDNIHFNVVGLAALAEHMWPAIDDVLAR